MRILIVPDKFKGTLTAQQAAEAIGAGWRSVRANDQLELLPMSDGGDGFGEILSQLGGAEIQSVRTVDAAHRPIEASWWWNAQSRTAIIESARVIGLALLPPGQYHPFQLDTYGLGAVLEAAIGKGARRCIIGIGGSATNDAGFGLGRALGWQFSNGQGQPIEDWTELVELAMVLAPKYWHFPDKLIVAVDVQNPLLGPTGCTRVYGPQKGLRPEDFQLAERCLAKLSEILTRQYSLGFANEPGAGAAGGLGFGLRCFTGATLQPGIAIFSEHARLAERIRAADLVITGEGAIDRSTLMGKGVGEVARLCRELKVPCIGVGGVVPHPDEAASVFTETYAIAPGLTTPEEAMKSPRRWLEQLSAVVAGKTANP